MDSVSSSISSGGLRVPKERSDFFLNLSQNLRKSHNFLWFFAQKNVLSEPLRIFPAFFKLFKFVPHFNFHPEFSPVVIPPGIVCLVSYIQSPDFFGTTDILTPQFYCLIWPLGMLANSLGG